MNFLERLFSRGSLSSMRWVFIWTYAFVVVIVFGSWAIQYLRSSGIADIPLGVAGLAGTVITVVTTGKYLQSKEEAKSGNPISVDIQAK